MNKKSVILIIIILIFGVLGFWAMIRYQGQTDINTNQTEENVNTR